MHEAYLYCSWNVDSRIFLSQYFLSFCPIESTTLTCNAGFHCKFKIYKPIGHCFDDITGGICDMLCVLSLCYRGIAPV